MPVYPSGSAPKLIPPGRGVDLCAACPQQSYIPYYDLAGDPQFLCQHTCADRKPGLGQAL